MDIVSLADRDISSALLIRRKSEAEGILLAGPR